MKLTVLGASGSYPGQGRASSGYLVRSERTTVWLDAGSGTLANLQRFVAVADVDAVVISHEHPDHTADLNGAYVAAKYYLDLPRIPVYAPASVRERAYYDEQPLDWTIVADGDRVSIGELSLTFSRTDHPPETLAVRVDGPGGALGYSADSGPAWSVSALGHGLDLAVVEATLTPDEEGETQHLSARQAGAMAREAGVGRLVITHLPPGRDRERAASDASDAFGAAVVVADDLQEHAL